VAAARRLVARRLEILPRVGLWGQRAVRQCGDDCVGSAGPRRDRIASLAHPTCLRVQFHAGAAGPVETLVDLRRKLVSHVARQPASGKLGWENGSLISRETVTALVGGRWQSALAEPCINFGRRRTLRHCAEQTVPADGAPGHFVAIWDAHQFNPLNLGRTRFSTLAVQHNTTQAADRALVRPYQ
jgi:hypothetical protein